MKRIFASALSLLSVLGCSKDDPKPAADELSRGNAAIRAMTELDTQAVAECQRAVDACEARVPEGKAAGVCERLAARCDTLNERLANGRGPAVACWKALDACEQHAPEQAGCSSDPSLCEALANDAARERDKTLECQNRVQACLTRSESLPEAAAVACDNMAAACERAAAGRDKGDAGAEDDDDEQGDRRDAGAASDDDDEQGDDQDEDESDDQDEDEDGDEGNGSKPRPDRPDGANGRGRGGRADAGVGSED
jgi:hypothetical protein